jgi:hypothetical protein
LQPAAAGSLPLRFAPASVGGKTATLTFTTDDPARATVAVVLLGQGRPAPRLTIATVVDFGSVAIGDTRDTTLDARNTGLGPLDMLSQSIGGGDAAMFRIVIPAATPIAQGQFSRMTLRFLPSAEGQKTSNLTLVSSDTVNPVQIVTLTGNGTTTAIDDPGVLPATPQLHANHPNPFAAATEFAFTLPAASAARVAVVDALGREAALLYEGSAPAGRTALRFDAARLPDGLYFAVLRSGGRLRIMPMVKAGNR